MKTKHKILKEEINRFKEIINYRLLVENNIAVNIIKQSLDDVIKNLIKNTKDDIIKRVFNYGNVDGGVYGQFLRIVGEFKANIKNVTDDVVRELEEKLGRKLIESEKSSVRVQLEKTLVASNKELQKSFSKSVDDVIGLDNIKVRSMTGFIEQGKTAAKSTTKATSTALAIIPIGQLDDSAKKTANNIVIQLGDDVSNVRRLIPASGKNIAATNRKFFVDFFGKAKLITDVGGRKIMTRRNLLIAAAIIGISYLTLESDLKDEGVQVESDTVDTTSCLGKTEDSTNHPGKQYYEEINEFQEGSKTIFTYYTTGSYYEFRSFSSSTKYFYPKGDGAYYRFYCSGKEIVKTKEIVNIEGKPLGTTTPKVDDESPVTGGDTYTGGSGWRSLGPTYDKEILQALGNNEDRRLNDEDIKNIYNKLKTAGKVN